jgi:ATP-dependent DNA helicase RecG
LRGRRRAGLRVHGSAVTIPRVELEQIQDLLRQEDGRAEWKEVGDPEKIVRTLVAFANDYEQRGGGYVLCGVAEQAGRGGEFPRPELVGLDHDQLRDVQGKVLTRCRKNLHPPLMPSVDFVLLPNGRRLLVFHMPASPGIVTLGRGQSLETWIRTGDRTIPAPGDALERLRKKRWPPFLDRVCTEATLEDVDVAAVESTLAPLGLPLSPAEYLRPDQPFIKSTATSLVGSARGPASVVSHPRYLALLLFGHEPSRFIRGAHAQLSVYPGTARDASGERYDLPSVGLPMLLDQLLQRVEPYMGTAFDKTTTIDSGRQNRPRYARAAVQEAIVNALVHRDYESDSPVKITVFSDRLEVQSPGGLVPELDEARMRSGRSGGHWRNRSLVSLMVALGKAQEEGQGIPTIINTTKDLTGREPEFVVEPGMFTVVIPASRPAIAPSPYVLGSRRQGVVLVSIGGPSITPQFEQEREKLGLRDAEVLVDIAVPGYISPDPDEWRRHAELLRDRLAPLADRSDIAGLHVFYRGPVVLSPLFGALVAPIKPLHMYHLDPHVGYTLALSLDRKFLREAH